MSDIKIGYLRRDDDGHWFLIPENLITAFDKILRQELPDEFCHTGEDFEELWESEMIKFDKYRLKGGIVDLKVLMS